MIVKRSEINQLKKEMEKLDCGSYRVLFHLSESMVRLLSAYPEVLVARLHVQWEKEGTAIFEEYTKGCGHTILEDTTHTG